MYEFDPTDGCSAILCRCGPDEAGDPISMRLFCESHFEVFDETVAACVSVGDASPACDSSNSGTIYDLVQEG